MYEYASDAHAVTTPDLDTELARVANEYASRGWDLVAFTTTQQPDDASTTRLYTAFRKAKSWFAVGPGGASQSSSDTGEKP